MSVTRLRTLRPGSSSRPPGCVVSRCHDQLDGVGSVLPAVSVERTSAVWRPSVRPVKVFGLVQALHAPASMRHSNVDPGSEETNVKVAAALLGSAG